MSSSSSVKWLKKGLTFKTRFCKKKMNTFFSRSTFFKEDDDYNNDYNDNVNDDDNDDDDDKQPSEGCLLIALPIVLWSRKAHEPLSVG